MDEIQEHTPALAALKVDQDVNYGTSALHLAHVKRPLVALEEHVGKHLLRRLEEVHQELPLVFSVLVRGDESGQRLHVGSADVPSWIHRSKAELPLSQVPAFHTGLKGYAGRPVLALGIDTVGIHSRRSACGIDNRIRINDHKMRSVRPVRVKADQTVASFSV